MRLTRAFLVLLFISLATTVRAQYDFYEIGEKGTVRLGAFGGVVTGGDVDNPDGAFGVDLVYQHNEIFSIEFVAAFWGDDLPSQSYTDNGVDLDVSSETTIMAFSLLGRAEVPVTSRLSLYGAGGGGFFRYDVDHDDATVDPDTLPRGYMPAAVSLDVDTDNEFAVHLAVGAALNLSEFFECFLEYRYTLVDLNVDYDAEVELTREVEVGGGEGPDAAPTETRILTQSVKGSSSTSPGYDHGMVRLGINMSF